jgi:hypothetical protein
MPHNYPDPGQYDERAEARMRANITVWAQYAEAGVAFDPSGDYLCGTCRIRQDADGCLRVGQPGEGLISFTTGSCRIYQIGEPLAVAPMPTKLTKSETGYTERPHVKGFGCRRCDFSSEAIAPDSAARPSWCSFWGLHVLPNACCAQNEGPDDIVAEIGRSLFESILRQRIGRNLDRAGITGTRRAEVLATEVAKAIVSAAEEQAITDDGFTEEETAAPQSGMPE